MWDQESWSAGMAMKSSTATHSEIGSLKMLTQWTGPLSKNLFSPGRTSPVDLTETIKSNDQMYIWHFIYIWNYLIHSRLPLFSITPRSVPCRTPWEERGQETRDGGISSDRTVCPSPPRESTLKTAEELPRRARTKTHSVLPVSCQNAFPAEKCLP